MVASRNSLNLNVLQSELLEDSIHATILVPRRELRSTQGDQTRDLANLTQLHTTNGTDTRNPPNHANAPLSFLPSTVPDTIEQFIVECEILTEVALMEGEEDGVQSQESDNATQEISQSALEVVKSRSERISLQDGIPGADREDDHHDILEDTPQEGDSNFLDILSSFAVPPVEQDSVPVNFFPSQSQPLLTQYPESQRFKTPATAGKKRHYTGSVLATPAVSRNPFVRDVQQTPGNVVGLSQAFAQTQAPSSPCVHVPTSALGSDRPSPGLVVEKHIAPPTSSSPLCRLSDGKSASTEPASRYVPAGHSQLSPCGSADDAEMDGNAATQTTDRDGFDSGASTLDRQRRARLREARAREQLKTASSPISPEKHHFPPPRRAESEGHATTHRTSMSSLPSSPPPVTNGGTGRDNGQEVGRGPHRSTIEDVNEPHHTEIKSQNESPHVPVLHQKAPATIIPDTTKRDARMTVQTFSPTQASPSARQTRSGRMIPNREVARPGPVRVANSQRSAPSTQQPARKFPAPSSGDSVDVVPASPEAELVATQPSDSPPNQTPGFQASPHEDESEAEADGQVQASHHKDQDRHGLLTPTIPETSSGRELSDVQRHSTYVTAPTIPKADPLLALADYSSQPVQPHPGRKRKRMEDMSQEELLPRPTQTSSFDATEALALDEDPDAAQALASTQDEDPILPCKRARYNLNTVVPRLELQETRSLSKSTNANIGRRVNPKNVELAAGDDVDDDVENNAQQNQEDDETEPRAVGQLAKTPTKVSRRQSAWDVDDSPKPRHVPKVLGSRSQPAPKTLQHKAMQRVRRNASRHLLGTSSALPSIEEASPDPLAVSMTTNAPPTPQGSIDQIVVPNMVFAVYMDRSRAWYPAVCLGSLGDMQHHKIRWQGYDPEDVPSHGICSLDLRIGDEVKVALKKFPAGGYIIRGFHTNSPASKNTITDIYGHSHVLVQHKESRVSFPKGFNIAQPVAIADIYISLNTWNRVRTRRLLYKVMEQANDVSGVSTPLNRAQTPTTPCSRSHQAEMDVVLSPSRSDGLFTNMVFVLSFDEPKKRKISDLIIEHGGLILGESFQDLVDDTLKLKDRFHGMGFAAFLTDRHSRKAKYMQTLALGLPCLSGKWAEASVKQSSLANWQDYLLPAGESAELDGAVRSRIMPNMEPLKVKLVDMLVDRPQFFTHCTAIFVNGRVKAEKRSPHLFLVRAMGAEQIETVADLSAAKEKLQMLDKTQPAWLFVDDKDCAKACKIVADVEGEPTGKSNKRDLAAWTCEVAENEFVMQSLIMGRLCSRK